MVDPDLPCFAGTLPAVSDARPDDVPENYDPGGSIRIMWVVEAASLFKLPQLGQLSFGISCRLPFAADAFN